ncbi:MAG: chromate efflux transporter [Silicimonas sp.]|nr:chromate efflux transporter [Silicimonas sp.]
MPTAELFSAFGRIGLMSFGGPAAQISLMHKVLVDEKKWLTEEQFLNALSFCMMLPGPEAMQLATYSGWRLRGTFGGLIAGLLFVVPGALVIAVLAGVYVTYGSVPVVASVFLGVKAVVVVIVIDALLRIAGKAFTRPAHRVLAVLSFLAIFVFHIPFPLIVLTAGLWGWVTAASSNLPTETAPARVSVTKPVLIWGSLWAAPILGLWAAGAAFLTDLALFFSKLAVVTFGGAYAVLAYMTQEVVVSKGWIETEAMIDGLGLAETTPGPLILVTEFVGFLAGFAAGGLWMAIAAAIVTLWVTFIPCFLWIFAGAPFIDQLTHAPRFSGALKAITAAVVGVIANLSLWFAAHVFFGRLSEVQIGPARILTPDFASLQPLPAILAIGAALLMFNLKLSLEKTLIAGGLAGLAFGIWA